MRAKIIFILTIALIAGSVWATTKTNVQGLANTKLSQKTDFMAHFDQFLKSRSDLATEMVSPASKKGLGDFALSCFYQPNPPKPPVSGHCGGWGNWNWDFHWGWFWGWGW